MVEETIQVPLSTWRQMWSYQSYYPIQFTTKVSSTRKRTNTF